MRKLFLILFCVCGIGISQASDADLEVESLIFSYDAEENITWQEDTVVDYAEGELIMTNQTLILPEEVLSADLAETLLLPDQKVQFTQENGQIVKLNLFDQNPPEKTYPHEWIGALLAVLFTLAIIGVWRKFYKQAKA